MSANPIAGVVGKPILRVIGESLLLGWSVMEGEADVCVVITNCSIVSDKITFDWPSLTPPPPFPRSSFFAVNGVCPFRIQH